jgi:hypothetical protein
LLAEENNVFFLSAATFPPTPLFLGGKAHSS